MRNLAKTCGRKRVCGACEEMGMGSAGLGASMPVVASIAVRANMVVGALEPCLILEQVSGQVEV